MMIGSLTPKLKPTMHILLTPNTMNMSHSKPNKLSHLSCPTHTHKQQHDNNYTLTCHIQNSYRKMNISYVHGNN